MKTSDVIDIDRYERTGVDKRILAFGNHQGSFICFVCCEFILRKKNHEKF